MKNLYKGPDKQVVRSKTNLTEEGIAGLELRIRIKEHQLKKPEAQTVSCDPMLVSHGTMLAIEFVRLAESMEQASIMAKQIAELLRRSCGLFSSQDFSDILEDISTGFGLLLKELHLPLPEFLRHKLNNEGVDIHDC
jgi:hypothetical protein